MGLLNLLQGCVPKFLRQIRPYSGWILTGLGTIGFAGTVAAVGNEAPKAQAKIFEAEEAHYLKWMEENGVTSVQLAAMADLPKEAYLPAKDKIAIAAPVYIPAILLGTATLACFWGAQAFNVRTQGALLAAYGTLAMQFDQYRGAIRNEYGEEADKKAYLESEAKVRELQGEIRRMTDENGRLQGEIRKLNDENGPFLYELSCLPGVIFEETPGQLYNALMHYNHNAVNDTSIDLKTLYDFCGIPEGCYNKEEAYKYGWQAYENEASFGDSYIDFTMEQVKNRDGRTVNIINTYIPPYEIDIDYGFEGDSSETLYPRNDRKLARQLAEKSCEADVYRVPKNWACWAVHFG